MWKLALGAVLVLGACGTTSSSSSAPLSPAIAGTWDGLVTIAISGKAPIKYESGVTIAVDGNSAIVVGMCPSPGTDSITATGSGGTATWSGNYVCPPITLAPCTSTVFTYGAATLTFDEPDLTIVATGGVTDSVCSAEPELVTVTFSAFR